MRASGAWHGLSWSPPHAAQSLPSPWGPDLCPESRPRPIGPGLAARGAGGGPCRKTRVDPPAGRTRRGWVRAPLGRWGPAAAGSPGSPGAVQPLRRALAALPSLASRASSSPPLASPGSACPPGFLDSQGPCCCLSAFDSVLSAPSALCFPFPPLRACPHCVGPNTKARLFCGLGRGSPVGTGRQGRGPRAWRYSESSHRPLPRPGGDSLGRQAWSHPSETGFATCGEFA